MDWQQYERQIVEHFQSEFPDAHIEPNAKVTGRLSGVKRQVDVLIDGTHTGFHFRVAIDAKHRSRRADVADVEAFIGMCADIGVSKGVLVSLRGFTAAAISRAHNDQSDIELDVLNFADLGLFQGLIAIPFAGNHGVVLAAPFGWVVDAQRRQGAVATLYQRGRDLQAAGRAREWMYINFWSTTTETLSIAELMKKQEEPLLKEFPNAEIVHKSGPCRQGEKTMIRTFRESSYPAVEVTGFVEFEKFIFFCVMFTPEELLSRNQRKLNQVLSTVLPVEINHATA